MTQKIRVLQVLGGLYTGGAESYVMNMYRSIDKEKVSFDFLIHERSKAHYDDEVLALGGTIYRIPDRTETGTLRYIRTLIRELRRIKPDVVHAHTMLNSGIVMFASFVAGIQRRIAHSHSTADQSGAGLPRKIIQTIMRRSILMFATDLAACGDEAAVFLFGAKASRDKKAYVLNNAVNLEKFKYDEKIRSTIREELGLADRLVLGHVGRFIPLKNHSFIIDVFREVHQRQPESVLLLIGDGELRQELERKAADLGLTSAVKFLGIRSDVAELMQGMDLFLFPSVFEGFPVVLVEAQATGLRCIAADTITRDTNVTGRVTFLSLQQSPDTWAREILRTSSAHEDATEHIRRKGYDTATMAERLSAYYRG